MSVSRTRAPSTVDPTGEFPLDLTSYLFHVFAVVSRHREARLEASMRTLDLSLARHRALSVISTLAPCTMTELADYSAVDRTTLTRTVDQLVEAGLVERTTPKADRRQVLLTLTASGADRCRKSLQAVYRLNRELLTGIHEPDARAAARALEAILSRLVDDEALLRQLTLRGDLALGPR